MQSGECKVSKAYVYILLFSFAISLVGVAKLSWTGTGSASGVEQASTAQKLKMLATIRPESPQTTGFLQSATQNQESSREVGGD